MSLYNENTKQTMMMQNVYSRCTIKRCTRQKKTLYFWNKINASNISSVLFLQGEKQNMFNSLSICLTNTDNLTLKNLKMIFCIVIFLFFLSNKIKNVFHPPITTAIRDYNLLCGNELQFLFCGYP